MMLLYTTDKSGAIFIRTDQLDGETDWKLRRPIQGTQRTNPVEDITKLEGRIVAEIPNKQIYEFEGFYQEGDSASSPKEPLSLENTLWANTIYASPGFILGAVIYTGKETRAQMNAKSPVTKFGKLDHELNLLSKYLFLFMIFLSLCIVAL